MLACFQVILRKAQSAITTRWSEHQLFNSLCIGILSINAQKTWAHKPQSLSDIKLLVIWRVVSLRGVLNLSQLTEYHPATWNLHSRKRKNKRSHLSYLCTIKCTAQRGLQELLTSYCLFLYQIRVLIHTKGQVILSVKKAPNSLWL